MNTYIHKCTDPFAGIKTVLTGRGGIFLDRDGTIIEERHYLRKIEDIKFIPGVLEGLAKLKNTGLPIYIITNQAGIAHGLFDEQTLSHIHHFLLAKLNNAGIGVRGVLFCPHHPLAEVNTYRDNCFGRKPNPGLILQIASFEGLDLKSSYMIGDKIIDITAGKRAGAKSIMVLTGYGHKEVNNLTPPAIADFVAANLKSAAGWILKDLQQKKTKNKCIF